MMKRPRMSDFIVIHITKHGEKVGSVDFYKFSLMLGKYADELEIQLKECGIHGRTE